MDFGHDERTRELCAQLQSFMDSHIYPAEPVYHEQAAKAEQEGDPWRRPPVVAELKAAARERGLWNLFLPGHSGGAGLTNLQYAPLAEITGHSPALAPEALNCSAPDTGNMEVLAEFGSTEQQARWLKPLLDGAIRSAFCMTEPDVASSDATNIATRIQPRRRLVRDQRHQVVVLRGDGPGLRDPHRDGQDRPGRRAAPAAVDDPGAQGHPRRQHPPRHAPVRLRRRAARRARRGPLRRRRECPPPT